LNPYPPGDPGRDPEAFRGAPPARVLQDRAPPPSVRLEGVSAGYGDGANVISGASLDLAAGATAVVHGAAGAGKTTLMHTLRGALAPRSGRVLLLGSDVNLLPARVRAALKRRIGYIAQTPLLIDAASTLDNVMAPLMLTAAITDAMRTDVAELIAYLSLTPLARQPAGTLSHVQRRLVAVARAFVARPDIVLADEPLVGLGADAAGRVLRLLSEIARQRSAVVIATQAPEMFAALPAARWRIDGGRIGEAPA